MKNWGQYLYYGLIGVLSVIMLIFVPMLGTGFNLALVFPTTVAGWMVWSVSKIGSVALNFAILHCFIKQAELNISNNPRYIQARDMLIVAERKEDIPLSPKQYFGNVYRKKGFTLTLTTLLSLVGFSQAIITFSLVAFLTQLMTMTIAVVFGILQMKDTEKWWCNDYLRYAKYYTQKVKEQKQNDIQQITECAGKASS